MPKATSSVNSLTSGEWSPKAKGRYDLAKYASGVGTMENFLINQLGGGAFRPGTRYLAETKDSSKASRLIPFQYQADQDYVVEVGDLYMKMYENDGDAVIDTVADSYTKLLIHFNGADGATAYTTEDTATRTVTFGGTAQLDTAQKEFGASSLLLDGDSDYVTVPDSADWTFLTGDFTIEKWVRFVDKTADQILIGQMADANNRWQLYIREGGKLAFYAIIGSAVKAEYVTNAILSINNDEWHHLAVVRTTTSIKMFLDGVPLTITESTAIASNSLTDLGAALTIGYYPVSSNAYFGGWIDEVRVTKGLARYTVDFSATLQSAEWNLNPTVTTEVVTTYLEADLFDLQYAQNNDIMYIVHPDYPPRKLSRTSATAFSIADVSFVRGPFLDANTTATTITPSAATGTGITLTASTDIFDADHVGSYWRINKDATAGAVVKITAFTSATVVTGDVQAEPDGVAGNIGGTGAYTDWAEGAFSAYRGYPSAVAFHEQRLYYANTSHEPQKFWGSVIATYDSFSSGYTTAGAEATVTDTDAITFEVATEQRNAIKWLSSGTKALIIGTIGGTFSASSGDASAPIAVDNIMVSRDTNYGVAAIMPKRISSLLYYVQRDLLRLRELAYSWTIDATVATDMTLLAEHILRDGGGVVDIDHQQSPNDRIWCVRSDGQIAVLTRNPEQEVMGWNRIVAGTDAVGDGVFESVCVIPKSGSDDQVWVIVKRNINGSVKRYIEFFMPEEFDEDWDSVNCDCSLTLDYPKTITGATAANPVVITATAHGFSNGDQVKINGVVGMTELNDQVFLVADKTDDTFELTSLAGVDTNGTAYTAYISGGEVRKMVTNISGLSHLEGETVVVQTDGYLPSTETYTVSGGAITLSEKAAVVHAGLPYTGTIQLLKLSDGSATGTGQTQQRRIYKGTLRLHRTQGLSIGRTSTTLDDLNYNDESDSEALFTGDMEKVFQTTWYDADELQIKQTKPLPALILAIILESEVS